MKMHTAILLAAAIPATAHAQSVTISCAAFSSGAIVIPASQPSAGTIAVLGAPLIGLLDGGNLTLHAGPVPCLVGGDSCYADCDTSGTLNIFDYICFSNAYGAQEPYADCDMNGVLNIFDYLCFSNAYAAGCP